MRVVIPVWNGRVAPVFDSTRQILIADISQRQVASRFTIPFPEMFLPRRAVILKSWGVELLVCGGISGYLAGLIAGQRIRVIPGIRGELDDVLSAVCRGNISTPRFLMPGWRGWRRRGNY